jgi:hypothetical protein
MLRSLLLLGAGMLFVFFDASYALCSRVDP